VSVQDVDLGNVASWWEGILLHSKTGGIGEVGSDITHVLKDVDVLCVVGDGLAGLKGGVGGERASSRRHARTRDGVYLSEKRGLAGSRGAGIEFDCGLKVVWCWRA
jgi:hypothetical protein